VNIYARTNGAIFLGDVQATGTLFPQATGFVSFLTTPAGAVAKTHTQAVGIAAGGNLIIDSNSSLGAGTQTLTIGSSGTAAATTFRIQAGTSGTVTLTGRTVAVGGNFSPVFDVPGGPVSGVTSRLVLPGIVSGGGSGVISKIGLGQLTFSGANTWSGTSGNGFQIFGGTVQLDSSSAASAAVTTTATMALTLGTASAATAATFGGGGTFSINSGANTTTQIFTILQVAPKDNAISLTTTTGQANLTFNGATFNRTVVGGALSITTSAGSGSTSLWAKPVGWHYAGHISFSNHRTGVHTRRYNTCLRSKRLPGSNSFHGCFGPSPCSRSGSSLLCSNLAVFLFPLKLLRSSSHSLRLSSHVLPRSTLTQTGVNARVKGLCHAATGCTDAAEYAVT
jgi:hypothetical protein